MRLTFCGAAHEVTGSCTLVETSSAKVLIDCGLFQGTRFVDERNGQPFPFKPDEISAVIITHAHLDHVGRLPHLIKSGYQGLIYATPATAELIGLILEDAYDIMFHDHELYGAPLFFTQTDIAQVLDQVKPLEYHELLNLGPHQDIAVELHDSGHIFGAAWVKLSAEGKTLVFSGDLGNTKVPLLRETEPLPGGLSALVVESTYGGRAHENRAARQALLTEAILNVHRRGGVLMIPAFSLERTQEILYDLNEIIDERHELPQIPIFLDSPLAIKAMAVYRKYPRYYDEDTKRLIADGDDVFDFPGLHMASTREESKRINRTPGAKVIIAGAGMMNGGRILHHALRYLADDRSTLLIVGYQAQGTLGRQILEGQSPVIVLNESVPVRCQVKSLSVFSAHADHQKIMRWIEDAKPHPRRILINHGDPNSSMALSAALKEKGLDAHVVSYGETIEI